MQTTYFRASLFFFFLLLSCSISAQRGASLPGTSDCEEHASLITEKFYQDSIPEAFQLLKKYWMLNQSDLELLQAQTTKQLMDIAPYFGAPLSYKMVRKKEVEDVLLRITSVVKYEYHFVRLEFTFYKPEDGWILNGFHWDDQADILLQDD
jgi:hypothetical protein